MGIYKELFQSLQEEGPHQLTPEEALWYIAKLTEDPALERMAGVHSAPLGEPSKQLEFELTYD